VDVHDYGLSARQEQAEQKAEPTQKEAEQKAPTATHERGQKAGQAPQQKHGEQDT
jgi:hypothetical protein